MPERERPVPPPNVPLRPARDPQPAGVPDTIPPGVEDEGRGGVQPEPARKPAGERKLPNAG